MYYSLALQADGKILVGGNFTTLGGQSRALTLAGSMPTGRWTAASIRAPEQRLRAYRLAVQADGKILVGGYFTTLGGPDAQLHWPAEQHRAGHPEPDLRRLDHHLAAGRHRPGGLAHHLRAIRTNGTDWISLGRARAFPAAGN